MPVLYAFLGEVTGRVKIGKTTGSVCERLAMVQMMCADTLTVLGTASGPHSYEKMIHDVLSDYRSHGEWFGPEAVELIRAYGFPSFVNECVRVWNETHPWVVRALRRRSSRTARYVPA